MCGIVGFATTRQTPAPRWLETARDALRHRGPDGAGTWISDDGRIGLAHRRLAIVDLSAGGHQPMHCASGSTTVTYNGEIYNHRELKQELIQRGHHFRSQSDTEVLLAAYREWGAACLERLVGMFAFALYDAATQSVLLARDRAGEKPLFYRLDGGELRFASELKALLSDPEASRRIDPLALDCFLGFGYVPGAGSILAGYSKLPPAHAMRFDCRSGETQIWRYWGAPAPEATDDVVDEVELLDSLEALLRDAVQRQLVADVPVGILLSGGVDSSLVTALAAGVTSHIKTFTVGFRGHAQYDESAHARGVADFFGTQHTQLQAEDAEADVLPGLARQLDEPVIDSSIVPTHMVSQLVRQHCTVALGGDGGDELFGGYGHYSRLLAVKRRVGWVPRLLRQGIGALGERALPTGFKGRNWLRSLRADFDHGLPLIASYFDRRARHVLLGVQPALTMDADSVLASRLPVGGDLLERATRMDFENFLPEDILVKVDRASMLNSLELRAPFLDHRVIEFAFGRVPSRLKATHLQRKILLKRLAAKLLPKTFDLERKQGFSIPLASWLQRGSWRDLFRDVLLDSHCLFDRRAMRSLLRNQDVGLQNHERLFGLVIFELWRREYRCSL